MTERGAARFPVLILWWIDREFFEARDNGIAPRVNLRSSKSGAQAGRLCYLKRAAHFCASPFAYLPGTNFVHRLWQLHLHMRRNDRLM